MPKVSGPTLPSDVSDDMLELIFLLGHDTLVTVHPNATCRTRRTVGLVPYPGYYEGPVDYDYEPVEPGGSVYMGYLDPMFSTWEKLPADRNKHDERIRERVRELHAEDTQVLLRVPYTAWGDYGGDVYDRSNMRSLLRDYPDTFVVGNGNYFSSTLYLPVTWTPPEDGRAGLLEVLAGLLEHPVYDDEDVSGLQMEIAEDAWDAWLSYDVRSDLSDHLLPDDDALRADVYRLLGEQPVAYEAEGATDVRFPYLPNVIATLRATYPVDPDTL